MFIYFIIYLESKVPKIPIIITSLTDNRQTDGHTEYSEVHHLNVFVSCNINKGVIKIYMSLPHLTYNMLLFSYIKR